MNNLLAVTICCFATLGSAASAQHAGTLKGNYRIEITQVLALYDQSANRYKVSRANTHVTGESNGKGVLKVSHPAVDVKTSKIVGKEIYGETSLVFAAQNSGQLFVGIKIYLNERVQGILVRGTAQFNIPVRLVEGTIKQYVDGQPIKVEASPASSPILEDGLNNGLVEVAANTNTGPDRPKELDQMEAKVSAKIIEPFILTISKQRIVIDKITTEYAVDVKMKL